MSRLKGYKLSDEVKKKIGSYKHGNKYHAGMKHSEETKEKIRLARKRQDEKYGHAPHWKGGVSPQYKKSLTRVKPEFCEVCGRGGRIVWDHNHKTGEFRGWLCHQCNSALGFVGDNPDTLKRLSDYLQSIG